MDHIRQRIRSAGPKKILACDGGGIRGLLSMEVLVFMEELLRKELGAGEEFVLGDYFGFVAGTSTGAIIAACVALRMPAKTIRQFYLDSGKAMFDRASILKRLKYKFEDDKLADKLKETFGRDATLGSEKLKSVLMMVTRNVSTDSPWPLSNNPFAKYNADTRTDCNLKLPLWQLVRASTAAPTYFPPEVVQIGQHKFVFVDGGVTPYNNPAFLAFLSATSEPFGMNWNTGEKDLLVVSVGTGSSANARADLDPDRMNVLYNASTIPGALMYGALNEQDLLCRAFGKCLAGDAIDREWGDMIGKRGPVNPKLFTYMRYNVDLSRKGLDELGLKHIDPEHIQLLDSVQYMDELRTVGQALAENRVKREHFADFLTR